MKKILTIILSILLCVGAVGGSYVLFKHLADDKKVETPADDSSNGNEETPGEDDSSSGNKPDGGEADDSVNEPTMIKVWQLCTENAEFNIGDQIVITSQSEELAMGATQAASNRPAVAVTKSANTVNIDDTVQIITLEKGTVEGSLAFNVGTGYLYAPSSSSNMLKTHEVIDDNSSWVITIDANNVASIVAQGASTKNKLQFNITSGLFSCYSTEQNVVTVYKQVEVEQPNNENEELPTLKGLKIPKNEAAYIDTRMEMVKGAQLSLTEGDRALRFTCNISTELYNEVMADANKEIGMLVFPTKFFDQVNTKGYTYMDWIKVFDEELEVDYSYLPYDESIIGTTDTGYYMRYKLYNIAYAGINQNISCLGVLKTTNADGSVSYKYAALPSGETYQSNARSMAYLAAATLNANALGMESLTDAQLTMLKGFINDSVDKANGLTEATDDGSTYLFEVSPTGPKTVSVGQTFKVETTLTPDVNVPIWYRSTDTSVVTVDDQGNVTALKTGTAVIGVYVAGEAFGITVTVS